MKKLLLSLLIASFQIPAFVSGQTVVLGNGTAISVFSPLNRSNDYCVYEVIYFQSQIGLAGNISALAFQRHDGSNTDSIENVNIYMKHTMATELQTGNFDTSGYTLVYSGSFPNDSGAGWREVNLSMQFAYNNINNLQVLVEKGYQLAVANTPVTPRWIYTNTGTPTRARRYYGNVPISAATSLATTNFTSNARLTFGTTGIVELNNTDVQVFPNPSTGLINFTHNLNSNEVTLKLYDITGHEVLNRHVENESSFSLDNLAPGIYFYSIQSPDLQNHVNGKFVISR